MSGIALRCVVDTNVATTANGANQGAPQSCVVKSAKALQAVMADGHVFVDQAGEISREYRDNLSASGQPGPGDAFLKWLLTHEWSETRCTRVAITPKKTDSQDYEELHTPDDGTVYDRSDRKFLAVSAAHPEHPPILQSFDSKWWGWQKALSKIGVTIHFVCPYEIRAKYDEKMGT